MHKSSNPGHTFPVTNQEGCKNHDEYCFEEKERAVIQDLQTQEKSCVEKYGKYAEAARDPELKNLFQNIQKQEEEHYQSLSQVLSGTLPACNCNDTQGRDYEPKASYNGMMSRKTSSMMLFWPLTALERKSWFRRVQYQRF